MPDKRKKRGRKSNIPCMGGVFDKLQVKDEKSHVNVVEKTARLLFTFKTRNLTVYVLHKMLVQLLDLSNGQPSLYYSEGVKSDFRLKLFSVQDKIPKVSVLITEAKGNTLLAVT